MIQNEPAPINRITKIELVETKSYKDMWIRPYDVHATHTNLDKVKNTVNLALGKNISNYKSIENLLNKNDPNILTPSANVIGKASIANGWDTKRFKVTIVLEITIPGTNITTINYIQGYSSYLGVTHSKNIDENHMEIFINSVKVLNKTVVNGQVHIRPVGNYTVSSNDEIIGQNMNNNASVLARPDDLVSKHTMLKEVSHGANFVSNLSTLNEVQLIDKNVLTPVGHLSKTISNAIDIKIMENSEQTSASFETGNDNNMFDSSFNINEENHYGMDEDNDIYDNLVSEMLSITPSYIGFYKLLYNIKGVDAKSFTLKDLEYIDPMCIHLERKVYDMDNFTSNIPPKMLITDAADTYDGSYETRVRVLIHEHVEKIMNIVNLNTIVFDVNNLNGTPDIIILSSTTIINGMNLQQCEEAFKRHFLFTAWPSISNNNLSNVKLTVSHMVTDITIAICLDGRPNVIYRDPIFADSNYNPLIVTNDLQSIMAENYGEILDTTFNQAGVVLKEQNMRSRPLEFNY